MQLDMEQLFALRMMLSPDQLTGIITGGPGTGKTTILRQFLAQHNNREEAVILLAPTGRAARRIAEVTNHTAYTIHRWVLRDGVDAIDTDVVVVVDEASMLDVTTLTLLLRHLEQCASTRLFFLGDIDQLPSVGAGNVLTDLIESGITPVVRLGTVYRSREGSWVAKAAPAIMQGEFQHEEEEGFKFVEAKDEEIAKKVVDIVCELRWKLKCDPLEMLVLVPQNVGAGGSAELNTALQARLNPTDSDSFSVQGAGDVRHHIKVGDRVIATINDYERCIFNGETGVVSRVEGRGDGAVEVLYDSGVCRQSYTKTEAAETLRLAYALTVHKAQGSEARVVIFIASLQHSYMLTRRLFYTAITRAKERVVIVGERDAIEHAVTNVESIQRLTTLRERIQHGG